MEKKFQTLSGEKGWGVSASGAGMRVSAIRSGTTTVQAYHVFMTIDGKNIDKFIGRHYIRTAKEA